jgi:hypothetical protein
MAAAKQNRLLQGGMALIAFLVLVGGGSRLATNKVP